MDDSNLTQAPVQALADPTGHRERKPGRNSQLLFHTHTHTHSLMTAQERGSSDSWRHQGWTVPGSGCGGVSSVTTGRVGVQHGNWASRVHLCAALGMKAPHVNLCAARTEWRLDRHGLMGPRKALSPPLWGSLSR